MDTAFPPWEPPFAGTETEALLGALERQRMTFRWKVDGLDAAGLDQRLSPSSLTLGSLTKHLAAQEDYAFTVKLTGEPMGQPWEGWGWDGSNDWEFESASDDTPDELYALWDAAAERSRQRLAAFLDGSVGMDALTDKEFGAGTGIRSNLRRLVLDMIEEYGRHLGQADLLREAVDGRVGEDPPMDWRP